MASRFCCSDTFLGASFLTLLEKPSERVIAYSSGTMVPLTEAWRELLETTSKEVGLIGVRQMRQAHSAGNIREWCHGPPYIREEAQEGGQKRVHQREQDHLQALHRGGRQPGQPRGRG